MHAWRVVKGADLTVGMRVRFGNVVSTVVDIVEVPTTYYTPDVGFASSMGYTVAVCRSAVHVGESRFRVDPRQSYRVGMVDGAPELDARTVARYRAPVA